MTQNQKTSLRDNCLAVRKSINKRSQKLASSIICKKINFLQNYINAESIGLYKPINNEIDLSSLFNNSKKFYYPKVFGKEMNFIKIDALTKFVKNKCGIEEPIGNLNDGVDVTKLDLIFVPLVAFDHNKNRIGMGLGYYDRYLARNKNTFLIGVAYEFQRQEDIQPDPWDIKLDLILTENRNYI
ncbi:MAG: 5-formyltetrahydrofolate cyclo-ligase [Legionellales bacterium RIFCSPHIGHO2_12_FULL_35_11]|nr:MAG: 5-formyltetrahydrofolate cyclo-ligase [Legionellales bacterium RIFCSPHIGHO2_12_FULL_35_11]